MTLTALQSLAFAALVVYFGRFLKSKISWIEKYNLPSPVIGGFIVATVFALLKANDLMKFEFTKTYEEGLMIAFFSSIGYSASFRLLKEGGRLVFYFLALTTIGLFLQIGAGIMGAYAMGENPLLGVLTGAVSLTGGPGTALAFAPAFEAAGIAGASVIGLTTAMGGILLGGLIGTPLATFLIHRQHLRSGGTLETLPKSAPVQFLKIQAGQDLLYHFLFFALLMGFGTALGSWLQDQGFTLPVYIGSMIMAAIFRNIEDQKVIFKVNPDWIEEIGAVALTLFIASAIMTLKLDELRHAALPILIFLGIQATLVFFTAMGPVYWLLGRNYEGAVTSAGYVGFMMGTTANAMANMSSITQRYGAAPKAFLIVPLVGSCFIDFINAAVITFCLNFWGR